MVSNGLDLNAKKETAIMARGHGLSAAWLFLVLLQPCYGWGQTSAALSATPTKVVLPLDNSSSTTDFTLSPDQEAKILSAIDSNSSTSVAAIQARPLVTTPPPVPVGGKVIILKEGIYLSWEAAPPTSSAVFYAVYRSTTPGFGYRPVNAKPLNAAYFLDGPPNSLQNPRNGEDYFYVIVSVDNQGNVSHYSDEIAVTPKGMEIPLSEEEIKAAQIASQPPPPEEEKVLNVPEQNVINLQLPAESKLSIQGYKKIDTQFVFKKLTDSSVTINGIPQEQDTTTVNQELVVNLKGKVGKNVDVNVDYSDVNREGSVGDLTKQDISIVYHGDPDSVIQEVAFGDLQLTLPNTEFTGFSKQLFGLEAKMKFDRFRFTSFFAQTKGIAVTKVFTGNTTQVDKVILDTSYTALKYFLITRASAPATVNGQAVNNALPESNSEQIWVNASTGQINPTGTDNFIGVWEHWLPGRDYTMDYATGVVTFSRGLPGSAQIAVGFTDKNGNRVGLNAPANIPINSLAKSNSVNLRVPDDGVIDNTSFLMRDNNNGFSSAGSIALSPLYLVNYFSFGSDKIIPPQQDPSFLFQVVSQGTNNALQTGQGGSSAAPYVFNLNLDLNIMSVVNLNFNGPPTGSPTYFPERPFANQDGTATQPAGTGTNDVYSQNTPPSSLFYIHLRYKTQLNFFKLDNINILRGSETVFLDGRLLRRDVDYFIDYTSGFLDFQDKSLLTPNSQIVVTYEYSPFGSFGQENILGARAEYDITDRLFVGSTFLMSSAQQPTDTPQLGSTPNSLALIDADAKYQMDQEDVQSLTGIIPGLEKWKPPISITLSGEVAQSSFNPDTYNKEGENGVALVDNMEGIDSVVSASLNSTSWLVASAPQPVAFLGSVPYDAGLNAGNNRVRFYNDAVTPNVDFSVNTSTAIPGGGGHVYAQTGQAADLANVLQVPYSHLTDSNWAGVRQILSTAGSNLSNVQFFQTWLYNDGVDKWVMFDFGVINEDSNGNGVLDSDAVTNQAHPSLSYGIPTYYQSGTPWYTGAPSGFIGYAGEVSQEGQRNGVFITENMDGTGILNGNNAYYEYGVRANWSGWRLVKIPVNFTSPDIQTTTSDGTSYFFHTQGAANPQIIRTLRLWATGTSGSPANGVFLTDSIGFAHNLWQLQVDPAANINQGVTVNSSKFDVNSVSKAQNGNYDSTLRFITIQPGQDQSAIKFNEKSLQIIYNLSSQDFEPAGDISGLPVYYTTRLYQQGLDFTDFQELRMDLQIRNYTPGEVLFVRLGNDQKNYYQYNLQLSALALNCLHIWGTVAIPLDGSSGNRVKVGSPSLGRTSQISIGVVSPNPPGSPTGELWVNNLRTGSPNVRTGTARRVNAGFVLGDDPKNPFATINTRYREVDSAFTQMDQTSTHFQHSTQWGGDLSSSGVKLFSQPLQTQFSYTHQDLYTEAGLIDNPYYVNLPNTGIDTATGSLRYTKELGTEFGRITSVNLSGRTSYEKDVYELDYLSRTGSQGNIRKYQGLFSVAGTYDAPAKLLSFPLGSNQFTGTYSLTHDTQQFDSNLKLSSYDRTTRVQTYGWTNTSELIKDLVFTPGYTLSMTDATGNTNSPGVPGGAVTFKPFLQQYQPKAGLVYHGNGFIPSVSYTGSNLYDFVSYSDGERFNTSNNINYSLNLTPGSWFSIFQQMNLTLFGGHTESSTSSIPRYKPGSLSFERQWGITSPKDIKDIANTSTESISDQLNAGFKWFDVWDFRPTGSWTRQYSLLSRGSNPVEQDTETLGLTTIYGRTLLTIPWVNFNVNSVQLQYTHTDSTQYDSSDKPKVSNETVSDIYGVTFPYDINKQAQGNARFQYTEGKQNGLSTTNIPTTLHDYQISADYIQKFAPNLELHIPFTHWKIKLQDAIEFRANFLSDFVDNESFYTYNQVKSEKYRGTIELNYNALKNLRIGASVINEYFTNELNPTLSYVLWQINISGEAKF